MDNSSKSQVNGLRPGVTGVAALVVSESHTALAMGSGLQSVLATPAMAALMEAAARAAVESQLLPAQQTVGTRLDIVHRGATPVGMSVTAAAELIAIEGRILRFRVSVRDAVEVVGEGVHERTIFSVAAFERLLRPKRKHL